jgi:hypothetical protein
MGSESGEHNILMQEGKFFHVSLHFLAVPLTKLALASFVVVIVIIDGKSCETS